MSWEGPFLGWGLGHQVKVFPGPFLQGWALTLAFW